MIQKSYSFMFDFLWWIMASECAFYYYLKFTYILCLFLSMYIVLYNKFVKLK